jgi:MFS family permease
MDNIGRKTKGLRGRFLTRMAGALVAFALAFLFLSKNFAAAGWPDYSGFIAGGVASLLLAYALSLYGPIGGRILIVGTLLILLGAMLGPLGFSFLRSPRDLQVLLYLMAAIADACGLLLVYRSTRASGQSEAPVADSPTATLDAYFGGKSPSGSPHKN